MSRMRARNTLFLAPKAKPNERAAGEKAIQPGEIPALLRSSPLKEKFYRDFAQILLEYLILTCDLPGIPRSHVIKDKINEVSRLLNRFLDVSGYNALSPSNAQHCAKLLLGNIIETNDRQLLANKILAKRIVLTAYSRSSEVSWGALASQPFLVFQLSDFFRLPYWEQKALIMKTLLPHYRGPDPRKEIEEIVDIALGNRGGRGRALYLQEKSNDVACQKAEKEFKEDAGDDINFVEVYYRIHLNKMFLVYCFLLGIAIAYGLDVNVFASLIFSVMSVAVEQLFRLQFFRQNFHIDNLEVNLQKQLMSGLEKGIDNLEGPLEEEEVRSFTRRRQPDQAYQELTEDKAAELRASLRSLRPITASVQDVEMPLAKPKQWRSTSSATSETKTTHDNATSKVITWHFDNESISYDPGCLIDANSRDYVVELHSYTNKQYNDLYYVHYREDEFKSELDSVFRQENSVTSKRFMSTAQLGQIVPDEKAQGYVFCEKQKEMEGATFKLKLLGRVAHRFYFFEKAKTRYKGRNVTLLGNPKLANFK